MLYFQCYWGLYVINPVCLRIFLICLHWELVIFNDFIEMRVHLPLYLFCGKFDKCPSREETTVCEWRGIKIMCSVTIFYPIYNSLNLTLCCNFLTFYCDLWRTYSANFASLIYATWNYTSLLYFVHVGIILFVSVICEKLEL